MLVDFPPESIAATAVDGLSEGCSSERNVHEEALSLELVSSAWTLCDWWSLRYRSKRLSHWASLRRGYVRKTAFAHFLLPLLLPSNWTVTGVLATLVVLLVVMGLVGLVGMLLLIEVVLMVVAVVVV